MTTPKAVRAVALAWCEAGASVWPVREDGSKAPDGEWKAAQAAPASRETVAAWFAAAKRRTGVGVVLGVDGFECLEFESEAARVAYGEAAEAAGLLPLLDRVAEGYRETTPGGGVHFIWRCTDPDAVTGNAKLAATADGKVLAETRGRGGFVIVAPSYGRVHRTGRPYQVGVGCSPGSVAKVTPEEREELLGLARSLDCRPARAPREKPLRLADGTRPGDAYNADGPSWGELLEPAGWTAIRDRVDGVTEWRRPGKAVGISATTNIHGSDLLWVFSTNADPFEAERSYDKFGAYAALEHDGNLKAAARALAADGYGATDEPERFVLLSARDLAQPVPPMRWMVHRVWPEKSHGPLAGAKKSLKSWNALALAIAVASGRPYLGTFDVNTRGPVLIFNGEGGQIPFARRYQRLCAAYGVAPADLPLSVTFGVGDLAGKAFRDAVHRYLDALQPVLVILDPLYVYHPPGVEAQNLYERGRMLGELLTLVGHDAALIVVDHYRKTGAGNLDLDEIGQSGVAQWADSWILQAHREDPDLEAGRFRLAAEHGSRQWGGHRWDIDWDCGEFDHDAGEPAGAISWTVERGDGRTARRGRRTATPEDIQRAILARVAGHPPATKKRTVEAVAAELRAGHNRVNAEFDALAEVRGLLPTQGRVPQDRAGKRVEVPGTVWVPGDRRFTLTREPDPNGTE
jgi:AAA domain/Bifunctional DNA primase/polymerase, N-terminal